MAGIVTPLLDRNIPYFPRRADRLEIYPTLYAHLIVIVPGGWPGPSPDWVARHCVGGWVVVEAWPHLTPGGWNTPQIYCLVCVPVAGQTD